MPLMPLNGTHLNTMQLAYKGQGVAEDLVLVHGLGANMAFWLQDFARHFSQYFRVTLYDLRGHGRSGLAESGYTPQHMAEDLHALMDVLDIPRAHIVAHSFGGVVALNLACTEPERVQSLVLADTHIHQCRTSANHRQWQTGQAIAALLAENGVALDIHDPHFGYHLLTIVARMRVEDQPIPEALRPWVAWLFGNENKRSAEHWLALMDCTQARDELLSDDHLTTDRLQAIPCPVLGIYGSKSQSLESGNYLQGFWPQHRFITLEGAGHFFPRSMPEKVISLCEQFWQANLPEFTFLQDPVRLRAAGGAA